MSFVGWLGYKYIAYTNDGSGFVENLDKSYNPAGNSGITICGADDYPGIEVGKFYHVTYSWGSVSSIISECATPDLDHGIAN